MSDVRPNRSVLPSSGLSGRRVAVLLVGLIFCLLAVGTRTVWLQSVKNRTLTQYARGQQQNSQILPAVRGDILDRNGAELAIGEEAVTFSADPQLVKDPASTAVRVARILDMSRVEEEALVERLTTATGRFAYVARQVPRERAELLTKAAILGISSYSEERRMYPQGAVAGQLLGRVDIDNKGLEGVEALYDNSLTGTPGKQVVVRDPAGAPIDVLKLERERDGRDVRLTIDATLQTQAELVLERTVKKFGADAASAIVLNPRTGEILAMAGVPRVNPANWGAFPGKARKLRAITDTYEPGSTFKVVAISGALEDKVVTPYTRFKLPYKLTFCNDNPKTCTVTESHVRGTVNLSTREILTESSNIGTITIAKRLGNKRFDEWVKRFGFGSPTGIDFPGESAGIMRPLSDWSDVSIGNIPIGQGISVTPMQLITAYSAIANDGVAIRPHFLKEIGNETPASYPGRRILSVNTARTMRSMFEGVVASDRGTGHAAGIEGYRVGGKTGTANVAGPSGYVKGKYIASFVGFVPAINPKLVTLVVVNEPTNGYYGGDVAAPAFEEITEFALNRFAIPPDGVL